MTSSGEWRKKNGLGVEKGPVRAPSGLRVVASVIRSIRIHPSEAAINVGNSLESCGLWGDPSLRDMK